MGAIQAVVGEQKSWVYWVGKHQGGFLEEVTSKLSECIMVLEQVLERVSQEKVGSISPRREDLPIIMANNFIEH